MSGGPAPGADAAVASAPGKILLAGEYGVLEGAEAVVMAVNRRVSARIGAPGARDPGPFVAAARDAIAGELGADSAGARAAGAVVVDSGALALPDGKKLGLGSSAAATVATIGCALSAAGEPAPPDRIHRLAHRAHAAAQGGRGSGVDVAASAIGGLLACTPRRGQPPALRTLPQPRGVIWIAAFTGKSAHTPALIAAAEAARARDPARYAAAISALAGAGAALSRALGAGDARALFTAIERGGAAVAELDAAVDAELVLPAHETLAAIARDHGGAAKPTGAAGGDLAIAALPGPSAADGFAAATAARQMASFRVEPAPGVATGPSPP